MIVGDDGRFPAIRRTSNGVDWEEVRPTFDISPSALSAVATVDSEYYVVGAISADGVDHAGVWISKDLKTWRLDYQSNEPDFATSAVTLGNTLWVGGGINGARLWTKTLATWEAQRLDGDKYVQRMAADGARVWIMAAVAQGPADVLTQSKLFWGSRAAKLSSTPAIDLVGKRAGIQSVELLGAGGGKVCMGTSGTRQTITCIKR